jgi:DNA-binding GntR family transcriptional regulator
VKLEPKIAAALDGNPLSDDDASDAPAGTAVGDQFHGSEADRLVAAIGARIMSGELAPGSKITEADLAKYHGVSRSPLREALTRLEERDLIQRVRFSGTRVTAPTSQRLREIYQMRSVLEGLAARLMAATATEEQIALLRASIEQSRARAESQQFEAHRQIARERPNFHSMIAAFSGNMELYRFLSRDIWNFSLLTDHRRERTPDRIRRGIVEHTRILDAIEARDEELADILMKRHIVGAFEGFSEGPG